LGYSEVRRFAFSFIRHSAVSSSECSELPRFVSSIPHFPWFGFGTRAHPPLMKTGPFAFSDFRTTQIHPQIGPPRDDTFYGGPRPPSVTHF
jgi:hypothetical protein